MSTEDQKRPYLTDEELCEIGRRRSVFYGGVFTPGEPTMWDKGTEYYRVYETESYIGGFRAALESIPMLWKPPFTIEQSCQIYAEYLFNRRRLSGQSGLSKEEIIAKLNAPEHADANNDRCERYHAARFASSLIASVPAEYW